MHRIFLGLAVTVGTLLVAAFVLGLRPRREDRAAGHSGTTCTSCSGW